MNNSQIDQNKPEFSIPDLIAELRERQAECMSLSEEEVALTPAAILLLNSSAVKLANALESVTAPTESERSTEIMRILNNAGAFCGECDYESGYGQDGCSQCAVTLATYARHLIAAGFRLPVPVEPATEVPS